MALALWRYWCLPGPCEQWGVLCWAAKNAALAALALALLAQSAQGLVAVVVFGGLAAWSIARLEAGRCYVPGVGPWPFS